MSISKDSDWVRRSFLVGSRTVTHQDMLRRELTEASYKFTDTTLGGNFAINPPPQFCRNADIKVPSRFANSNGMGRYYSEALDDRGQYVHMRFGVPQYNSLTNFFFNFYDTYSSSLANRARAPDFFYEIGKGLAFIVSIPVMPIIWAGRVVNFLSSKSASKYYYLKPAMPLYWNAVSTMVNAIGVNMGIIGRSYSPGEEAVRSELDPIEGGQFGESYEINRVMASTGLNAFSDVFRRDGGVDVYALATRAQRMAARNRENIQKALESSGSWDEIRTKVGEAATTMMNDEGPSVAFDDYIKKYHATLAGKQDESKTASTDAEMVGDNFNSIGKESGFGDYLQAELEDGAQFVTFRVDDVGTVSESFSNSTGTSSLADKLNSTTSSGRSTRFNIADGNFGDGIITGMLTGITSGVKSLVNGAMDMLEIQGIAAFSGNAFVDIPNVWQGSTADLPKASYTIELRSPYGNAFSRFQNLIVPLSMLLAGALPLSTGKHSYTSPFLVELYSKGRNQTRLGIIDSMTITRGAGNLGWTRNGEPLGIDVSFSVIDLSTILHMPIVSNFGAGSAAVTGAAEGIGAAVDYATSLAGANTNVADAAAGGVNYLAGSNFDDDNLFTDYMAVLGGLSLADQIYPINKLRLRKAQRAAAWEQWKSPAYHANWMAGTGLGQLAAGLTTATINYRNN